MGEGARGEILSVAYAGDGSTRTRAARSSTQLPPSLPTSKSISGDGQSSTYRGLLKVHEGGCQLKSWVEDALLARRERLTDTYPYIEIEEKKVNTEHEATVSLGRERPALLP